jgi:uncharacterized membrane protein YidH (DUF202 family)
MSKVRNLIERGKRLSERQKIVLITTLSLFIIFVVVTVLSYISAVFL